MPRASRALLPNKQLEELRANFSSLISSLNSEGEIARFFEGFLTKEEQIMLTKRLMLFMMIKRQYHPSAIQHALKVSYETIRTYTKELGFKNAMFHQTLEKLIAKEKTKEFWAKIDRLLKPLSLAMSARNDMKARAKLASGDWS